MSKFHEEYHPLLQDDESHICNTSPKFQRRFHSRSGRARAQAKGAAYIITRWPGKSIYNKLYLKDIFSLL